MRRDFPNSRWAFSLLLLCSFGLRAEPAGAQTSHAERALIALPTFQWIAPGDGETLPTNAVLFAGTWPSVEGAGVQAAQLSGEEEQPLSIEVVQTPNATLVLATPGPLEAGSTLAVVFRVPSGAELGGVFTVGQEPDEIPPAFTSEARLELSHSEEGATLSSPALHRVELELPAAGDDQALTVYVLERAIDDEDFAAVAVLPAEQVGATLSFDDTFGAGGLFDGPERACYRVRAFDAAANEAVLEEGGCVTLLDAGGCGGCASTDAPTLLALLPLLALALRVRRKQRA